jgi:hypothetical protein
MRIYIDTSVIGGCFDPEFAEWSNKLIRDFIAGRNIAVISDQTLGELEKAPAQVRRVVRSIPEAHLMMVQLDAEARSLARRYVADGAISRKHIVDAQHIAIATVQHVDFLASWNFKEMVNVFKIRQYNAVNLRHGYPVIDIRSPKELVYEK